MNQESQPLSGPPATDNPPPPSKLLPAILNWLCHYWDTAREKSKWTEIIMLVLTFLVVIAAFWSACIFQDQLNQARRANDLTERQWEAQNRPWIGLSGSVEFPKAPTFQVFQTATPLSTGIDLEWVFRIKNAGISPAFRVASNTQIWMSGETLQLPQFQMQFACSNADWTGNNGGSVLFPDSADITVSPPPGVSGNVMGLPLEITKIRRIWVIGCISYQDSNGKVTHHTKFWVVSNKIPDSSPPQVIEHQKIVTFYSLPITGWEMIRTEAD
jgi:hypothetical protein